MKILLLLGEHGEYLTYKKFKTDEELDAYAEKLHDLMLANITKELPLRKRLAAHLPDGEYFPFAGAVQDIEVIDDEP